MKRIRVNYITYIRDENGEERDIETCLEFDICKEVASSLVFGNSAKSSYIADIESFIELAERLKVRRYEKNSIVFFERSTEK